jgi:hypothetical protein
MAWASSGIKGLQLVVWFHSRRLSRKLGLGVNGGSQKMQRMIACAIAPRLAALCLLMLSTLPAAQSARAVSLSVYGQLPRSRTLRSRPTVRGWRTCD